MAINTDWHVTYEIVTPESAENGDNEEIGFVDEAGTQWELRDGLCGPEAAAIKDMRGMTMRDALYLFRNRGALENSGRWFSETYCEPDYSDGSETRWSLHPPRNITPASYARVARLVGAQS